MSYTSNSEYDANSRPTLTNEIPPYDYYQGVNSVLTDDMWKWLLGYTTVTYDLPSKEEEIDRKGEKFVTDKDDYYHKITNGVFSKDYGPKVEKVWNPNTNNYETRWPEYHSIEVYGGLATEEDLFLHEIYRYLSLLYPDHPEWLNLLTKNEINDAFINAAAIVNYKPDNVFFDLVAKAIDPQNEDEEAFKIKLRNLKNNSYRRKLYGSKFGYNMFAHDIFQTCSIFPLGTYIPIKAVPNQFKNANNETVDKQEIKDKLSDISIKKEYSVAIPEKNLNNRFIDTYDSHYYNKFRLIDWTGESQNFNTLKHNVTQFSLYNTPANKYVLYNVEYDDFTLDQNLNINDTFYNIENENNFYIIDNKGSITSYSNDMSTLELLPEEYTLEKISLSQDININYFKAYIPSLSDIIDNTYKPINSLDIQTLAEKTATNNTSIDIVKDPVSQGNIYLRPSKILSYYRSEPIEFNDGFYPYNDDAKEKYVLGHAYNPDTTDYDAWTWPPFNIDSESEERRNSVALKRNQILFNDPNLVQTNLLNNEKFLSSTTLALVTTGFKSTEQENEPGFFYIKNDVQTLYSYTAPETYTMTPTYGIIVTNIFGDKIVLLGRLTSIKNGIVNGLPYQPLELIFQVKVIPEEKDIKLLKTCYGPKAKYEDYEIANRKLLYNSDIISKYHKLKDEEDSYFILNNTSTSDKGLKVYGILHIAPGTDGYEIMPQFGTGSVTKYDFGNVTTIALYENNSIKNYASNIVSIGTNEGSIKVDDKYKNTSISFNNNQSFLLSNKYQKLDIDYNTVSIMSTIDISNESSANVIMFDDEVSRNLAKTLSVGDKVFGPIVPITDTGMFITDIGVNQVTVNCNFTRSGKYKLFYQCKLDISNTENDEKYNSFLKKLFLNDSLTLQNPFNLSLWPHPIWPNTASGFIDGYSNITQYKPFIKNNIYDATEKSWLKEKVIPELHSNEENFLGQDAYGNRIYSKQIIPCTVKFLNDVFIDLNINKVFTNIPNRIGSEENLINVEWIDYFSKNAKELTRSNDNVSFGAHLLMETDSSGFYSLLPNAEYTDPSVKLKFQTFNWNQETVPAYVQIGTGTTGLYDNLWKNSSSLNYPSLWNSAVYDDTIKDPENIEDIQKDYVKNKGSIKTRHVYTDPNEIVSTESEKATMIKNIENPIAEISLGEYDIQMHYKPANDRNINIDVTTVQCNFYKQTFNNITSTTQFKVFPEAVTNTNIFIEDTEFGLNDTDNLQNKNKMSFVCKGKYVANIDNKNTLILPDISQLIDDYNNGIIGFYIIENGQDFTNIHLSENILNKVYNNEDNQINNVFDKNKQYNISLKSMSILTIEKIDDKFVYINKEFTDIGLLGNLNIDNISMLYNESTISVKSMLKKALGTFTTYNATSIDLMTGDFTGSGYFSPTFAGIVKNNDKFIVQSQKDTKNLTVTDYNLALIRYFNKDRKNGDNTPYYINIDNIIQNDNLSKDLLSNIYFCYVSFEKKTNDIIELKKNKNPEDFSELEKSLNEKYYTENKVSDDDIIAVYPQLINNEIKYRLIKLNGLLKFTNSISLKKFNMPNNEWNYINDDETSLYKRRLNLFVNKFSLPRKYISEGSYDINFIINPKFESIVYNYDDYVSWKNGEIQDITTYEKRRIITDSAIFYDKKYDCFYVKEQHIDTDYENAGNEIVSTSNTVVTNKYVIKFNENRYFKNVNYSAGSYQVVQSIDVNSDDIIYTPTIKAVDGLSLNADKLTSDDILLQAELIQLRSIYNNSLKHKLFSSYQNIEGQLESITKIDDNNYQLKITYDTSSIVANENVENTNDPLLTIKSRNDMVQQVMGLLPAKITYTDADENEVDKIEVYSKDNVIKFENDTLTWDTKKYYSPTVVDFSASKIFSLPKNKDSEFKYFKNLLVFEARVDVNNPTLLTSTGSNTFTDVQQMISSGDSILQISALSGTSSTSKIISLFDTNGNPISIDAICYGGGKLVVASGVKLYSYATNDLSSQASINMTELSVTLIPDALSCYVSKIEYIDGYFYFSVSDTSSSTVITKLLKVEAEMIDSPETTSFEPAFEDSQAYINDNGNLRPATPEDDLSSFAGNIVYPIRDHNDDNVITILDWKSDVVNSPSIEAKVLSKDIVHSDIVETWTDFNTTNSHTYYPEGEAFAVTTSLRPVFAVDNTTGYQALIKGNYLFIKAPVALVDSDGEYNGDQTVFSHWKAAKLPEALDISYTSLFSMKKEVFREFVVGVLEGLANYDIGTEDTGQDYKVKYALREFIRNKFKEGTGPYAGKIYKQRTEEDDYAYKCGIMTEDEFEEKFKQNVNPNGFIDEDNNIYNTYISGFKIKEINDSKVGYIGDSYKYGLAITVDPTKPFNEESNPALYTNAYRQFVFDIFQYIFGYKDYIEMFKDGVSSAYFSDGKLYLKTTKEDFITIDQSKFLKREDLENAENWSILQLPPSTTFTSDNPLSGSYTLYVEKPDNILYSDLPASVPVAPKKAYHISTRYEDSSILIYGGYLMSRHEISKKYNEDYSAQSFESFCDECGARDYQQPFIMYSFDKSTFDVATINYNTIYDNYTKDRLSGSSANSRVVGFISQDGKIYALIATLNRNSKWILSDKVLQFSVNSQSLWEMHNNAVVSENGSIFVDRKNTTLKDSVLANYTFAAIDEEHENDAKEDSSESSADVKPEFSNMSSNTGDADITFVNTGNTIVTTAIADITAFDNSSILRIISNSEDGIIVSDPILPKDEETSGYIDILLSVYTSKDIIDPSKYIDSTHSNNFNSNNELKVNTVYEVEDPQLADRMYNKREVLGTIFEYDSETGEYKKSIDSDGYPSVEEDIDHKLYEYSEVNTDGKIDYVVTDLTNGYDNTVYLCNERGDYFVQNNSDTPLVVRFASTSKLVKNGLSPDIAFIAPKPVVLTVNEASKNTDLRQTDKDLTDVLNNILSKRNSKIFEFCIDNTKPYLIVNVATSETIIENLKKIVDKQYYTESTDSIIFNDSYGRFVKSTINVEYESYGSKWTAQSQVFVDTIGNKPVTSIYIPINGYGGTRDNTTQWTKVRPWNLDKEAWTNEDWLNNYGDPIYLSDKHGVPLIDEYGNRITMKIPAYQSFNALISEKGYEIVDTIDDFHWTISTNNGKYSQKGLSNITNIMSNYNSYTLSDKIDTPKSFTGNIDINDGKEHNIRFKFLTKQHIDLPISHMNDSNYIIEVPFDIISNFGYDRIYFNPLGYPKSPILINNTTFRSENNNNYFSELLTSISNAVYECDENGKYVGYSIENGVLKESVLGDKNGNLTSDITQNMDKRFQPYKMKFDSCQNWYKNEFFIENIERNPFWQTIFITSFFNNKTLKFEQKCSIIEHIKSSNTYNKRNIGLQEAFFKIYNNFNIDNFDDKADIYTNINFLNRNDGQINVILTQNNDSTYYNKDKDLYIKYGISCFKTDNSIFNDDNENILSYNSADIILNAHYSVNTTENSMNTDTKDNAIAQITEVGLFDKNHSLIAYAKHPPIEYRTDSQHLDYTMVISYNTLVEQ